MPDETPARRFPRAAVPLSLLAALPFLVARYPQMTDFPSHLARYRVMLDGGRDAFLARFYEFEWIFAGNLGADLLMVPLGRLIGLEPAAWLIGAIIPALTVLAICTVEWVLRGRLGMGSMLALATVWSPALMMGFYNFCLSLALALLAFAAWVRLAHWPRRWLLFLPVGLTVWLCHASGWGVLGVLVFGYEWHRRKGPAAVAATWPLLLPLGAQFFIEGARGALDFGSHVAAYKAGIWIQGLRGYSLVADLLTPAVIVAAILMALVARRIDGRLGWAALILAVLSLAMPRHFGGGDYADYRLIAAALMVGAMAIDWPARPAWLIAASLPFIARLAVTTAAWQSASADTARILSVVDHLPQGARVAGAVLIERKRWHLDPLEHVTSYATVRRSALVNSHFAIAGVHMLHLRDPALRALGHGFTDPSHRVFHSPGEPVDLSRFAPAQYADYLWYVGDVEPTRLPQGARVIYRAKGTLLARLAKSSDAR